MTVRLQLLNSLCGGILALAALLCVPATASPWAEVGDNQLRSDIAILAAAGVIDDITIHWPLPWNSIVADLRDRDLSLLPASVRGAAERVFARARGENQPGFSGVVIIDATNRPSVVYGFDGMGRGEGQAQVSLGYSSEDLSARVSLGGFSQAFSAKDTKVMPDGTYFATKLGGALIYGGYLDHWWGPGWVSSLALSNNARPMPQIGIERQETTASGWPVLHWLGPWQAEFLLGYLDGPRLQKDTYYNALRFTVNPLPGLELALSRTEEFCGQGHPCSPLRDYFSFQNGYVVVNRTNDQGLIDVKYTHRWWGVPTEVYMQLMNEDSSPINHSGTSHLFGGSVFVPTPVDPVRLTVEYTDSVPTTNIFSFGQVLHGFSYNNYSYLDGMRYRGRSLGFSLDSDSRLLTLQASWTDRMGRFLELSLHHAAISNPNIGVDYPTFTNVVTTAPVIVNMGEARMSVPLRGLKLDLAVRLQDDQPRPQKGFAASFETALRVDL